MKMSAKKMTLAAGAILIGLGVYLIYALNTPSQKLESLTVTQGNFRRSLSSPGAVEPENKIEIRPPVAGRIDRILVKEGDFVRDGQVIAMMSSTDRAALLDAAKAQGPESLKEWEKVYLPTPITSPSRGQIIRINVVRGQTAEAGTTLFELSDRLIIRANVDENDIGELHLQQEAEVLFDALDGQKLKAKVHRIGFSATTKDNLTTYEVVMLPEEVTPYMKSGMTVTVNYLLGEKPNAVLVPTWVAQGKEHSKIEVLIRDKKGKPQKRTIDVGDSNGEFVEVLGNLSPGEVLLYEPVQIVGGKKRGPLGF